MEDWFVLDPDGTIESAGYGFTIKCITLAAPSDRFMLREHGLLIGYYPSLDDAKNAAADVVANRLRPIRPIRPIYNRRKRCNAAIRILNGGA